MYSSTEIFPAYLFEYGLEYVFLKFSFRYTFSRFMLLAQPDCFHFPRVFYNGLSPSMQVYCLAYSDLDRNSRKKNFSSFSRETRKLLASCVVDKNLIQTFADQLHTF